MRVRIIKRAGEMHEAAQEIPTVVNPSTGKEWMAYNLGAERIAQSIDDEKSYGGYFQWGRLADGHEVYGSGITKEVSKTENPEHSLFIVGGTPNYNWINPEIKPLWNMRINDPSPEGFRLPTEQEILDEMATWATKDPTGAFGSVLKLPSAGCRSWDGTYVCQGTFVDLWTATIHDDDDNETAQYFEVNPYYGQTYGTYRDTGMAVRCIKI